MEGKNDTAEGSPVIGSPIQIKKISDDFVLITGGTFVMGSPCSESDRRDNESPQHQATVSSFYMGKYAVTQKEYQTVTGANPSDFKEDNLPVEQVSWYDAVKYCNARSLSDGLEAVYFINQDKVDPDNTGDRDPFKWLVTWNKRANGYRLPTETEWEYACRAGTTTPFFMGNNITTDDANYDGNYPYNGNEKGLYRETTVPVGSFMENAFGLYNMHGNVYEWCWDWAGDYPCNARTDLSGPLSGSQRILRGGSWGSNALILRSAFRNYANPSHKTHYFGFRLVLDARCSGGALQI
jgi:formylglycine-generating enzyme required for sulfatase activity